jgi:hypothetical protein
MKNLNVTSYRASEIEILSIYVCGNNDFTEEEAFNAILATKYQDLDLDFIEFDESVANFRGYKYCAIYHEKN